MLVSDSVLAQQSNSDTDCGREPWNYAVIIDASSSATEGDLRRIATEKYLAALSLINGMLCGQDRMVIYPLPSSDSIRWWAIDSLAPRATNQRLRTAVDRALRDDPGRSDLLLVTEHAQREVLTRPYLAAAFLLTDGSFYPYRIGPPDERLRTVRDRLSDLVTIANQIIEQRIPFYVVGIGSHANAIDDDLPLTRRERKDDRRWLHRGTEYDLLTMTGDSLLKVLFRHHFVQVDSIDTWNLVMANPDGPWRMRMGYTDGWSQPLRELRNLSIAHLVYRPDSIQRDQSEPCAFSDAIRAGRRNSVRQRTSTGDFVCSIADPAPEEIEAISSRTEQYIVRQKPLFHNVEAPMFLHGIYDYGIALGQVRCPSDGLRALLEAAGQFPPSQPIARMEVLPRSIRDSVPADSVRHLTLHQYYADCLYPSADAAAISGLHGRQLLRLTSATGTWMEEREFVPPRMKVTRARFHPGGFPFPPDRYGALRLCVSTRDKVGIDKPLTVRLASEEHELEPSSACPDSTSAGLPHAYQLDRFVPIDRGGDLVAVVAISDDSAAGAWIPLEIEKTGRWSLSGGALSVAIVCGLALQLGYLFFVAKVRFSDISFGRAVSISLSLLLSVVLVVVVFEFIAVIRLEGVERTVLRLSLVLLVSANALKLCAAILIPEVARDDLAP